MSTRIRKKMNLRPSYKTKTETVTEYIIMIQQIESLHRGHAFSKKIIGAKSIHIECNFNDLMLNVFPY